MKRVPLMFVLIAASCSTPIPVRLGAHQAPAPVVAISHPYLFQGDAAAGRRAFIDLQCIDCHRVAEDPNLPMGTRAIAGPRLENLKRYTANQLAHRITSGDTGANDGLFARTMKDYTQPMTARQLVDLVAYLRGTGAPRG